MDSEVGWVLEICRTCWKNLKTRRPDPSEPPSATPAEPRKAESTLSKPKPVAPKPPDVLDATFGDSDDDDDSNGGDNEEEDGGGHNEDPEEESHAEASCSPTCFSHVTHALSTSSLPPMRRQYPPMSIKIVAAHRKCDACHACVASSAPAKRPFTPPQLRNRTQWQVFRRQRAHAIGGRAAQKALP